MGKSELFSHFADRFEMKRTQAREFFDELTTLSEKELKRAGEFVLPGMDQDSGKDRRQGAHRQAAQGRGSAAQVAQAAGARRQAIESSVHERYRFPPVAYWLAARCCRPYRLSPIACRLLHAACVVAGI
jgi:hypothetical protein